MLLLLAAASSLQQQPMPGLTALHSQGSEQLPRNNVHYLQCSVLRFFCLCMSEKEEVLRCYVGRVLPEIFSVF